MSRSFLVAMARVARQHARDRQRAVRDAQRAENAAERQRKATLRASIYDAKQRKRQYQEDRAAEVVEQNASLEARLNELGTLLVDGLRAPTAIDFRSLLKQLHVPQLDLSGLETSEPAPPWELYAPDLPHALLRWWPPVKHAYEERLDDARRRFEAARRACEDREAARLNTIEHRRAQYSEQVAALRAETDTQNATIKAWREAFLRGEKEAVGAYSMLVLSRTDRPDCFPHKFKIAFAPASKQLVLEYDFPQMDESVPACKGYSYVRASDKINESPMPEKQRRAMYASLIAQTTILTLHELFSSDQNIIGSIVLNGFVDTIDPGTGQPVRPCIVTVRATREVFASLNIRHIEPTAALRTLNASFSKSPAELAPVRPLLHFDMVDPRFIKESDVLSTLDHRPNLMELNPSEFESLITNLFQKMGLETKLTQASRDGGVDCVAYDPRPIFGGKIVIQAKRYKHTVGVSAVRDLYGTMQNEGASKGILVTTSGYGRAAFDFISGKPMELLDGANLLYLLKTHAGIEAKIVVPEDWRDPVIDVLEIPVLCPTSGSMPLSGAASVPGTL
jgi:restriction system protein